MTIYALEYYGAMVYGLGGIVGLFLSQEDAELAMGTINNQYIRIVQVETGVVNKSFTE